MFKTIALVRCTKFDMSGQGPHSEPMEQVDIVEYETSPKVRFYDMDHNKNGQLDNMDGKGKTSKKISSIDSDQLVCDELLKTRDPMGSLQRMSAIEDSENSRLVFQTLPLL